MRLAMLASLLVGCQSYQPVTLPVESHLPQDPHIEVRVTEKSGVQSRLVETRFEHDSLIGRNFVTGDVRQAVALADIANLEIGEADADATLVLVAGVVCLVTVGFLYILSHIGG